MAARVMAAFHYGGKLAAYGSGRNAFFPSGVPKVFSQIRVVKFLCNRSRRRQYLMLTLLVLVAALALS